MQYLLITLSLISFIFLNTNEPKTENWYFLGGSGISSTGEIQADDLGSVNGTSMDVGFYWHYNKNTLYGFGVTGKSETLFIEQELRKKFDLTILPSLNLIHFKNDFGRGIFFRLGIGLADASFEETINDEIIYENQLFGLGYVMGCGYSYDYKGKSRYMISVEYGNSSVSLDYFSFKFTGLW